MNYYYLGAALTVYLIIEEIKKLDEKNKLKRFYSLFAAVVSVGVSALLFAVKILGANIGDIVTNAGMIYFIQHVAGDQLIKLFKSFVKTKTGFDTEEK
jgi:hypothetical protein